MLVLLEKTDSGFRASSGKPLEAETVGATQEEAISRLHEQNPFLQLFGALRDDPTFGEWQAAIEENRCEENEAAGIFPERNP